MAPAEKTEPVAVCLDSDVVIAGLFSTNGASHALLVLGEIGLLRIIIPQAAVDEIRRNLSEKLPDALPAFEAFLKAPSVSVHRPAKSDLRKAEPYCHAKDIPIMASTLSSGAAFLVTHNARHFRSSDAVQVVRPRKLVEDARAWMAGFGR